MAGTSESRWSLGASFLGGILLVAILGSVLRPRQSDLMHTTGMLTVKGGVALHAARFTMGSDALGSYTVFIAAKVAPYVAGDIQVELEGPAPVRYDVTSRYPPVVPLFNHFRHWYGFHDATLQSIKPGDELAIVIRLAEPELPGEYAVTFTNARNGQCYLTMPVTFAPPARHPVPSAPSKPGASLEAARCG